SQQIRHQASSCPCHLGNVTSHITSAPNDGGNSRCKVKQSSWLYWSNSVAVRIRTILESLYKEDNGGWSVTVRHVEHVKSYAPHVDHIVTDIECRPCKTL
uniref:Uncharacterized protein n=1 Tax=Amphimedon queenslandica TaxID=400682 RepID=A0A1X7SIN2_AMPQE